MNKRRVRDERRREQRVYFGGQAEYEATRACTGKRWVTNTKSEARDLALRISRQVGHRLKPYKCRFCSRFHLTSAKAYAGWAR